ncbi:unnamed protein product [Haemonchus placei]|uniref:Uncharacterized protein n=1 Tax=Haemonchus placei TaxID=6290 RepID=A0A0N4WRI4_HAEPC|nr:unnamed protein product [Haemonchus placei]
MGSALKDLGKRSNCPFLFYFEFLYFYFFSNSKPL